MMDTRTKDEVVGRLADDLLRVNDARLEGRMSREGHAVVVRQILAAAELQDITWGDIVARAEQKGGRA